MKKQFRSLFLMIIAIFGLGCQSVISQQNANSSDDADEYQKNLIETKTNDKHGLSLLFYELTFAGKSHIEVSIRDDKTQIEKPMFVLRAELLPAESRDLWSPNKEYLATTGSEQEINIYKASDLSKYFRSAYSKNLDVTNTEIKLFDNILINIEKSSELILHKFDRWKCDNSLVFDVIRNARENQNIPEQMFKYRYDTEKKKLFRLCPKIEGDSIATKDDPTYLKCPLDAWELTGFRKTAGSYKKGLIYPSEVKTEYYEKEK